MASGKVTPAGWRREIVRRLVASNEAARLVTSTFRPPGGFRTWKVGEGWVATILPEHDATALRVAITRLERAIGHLQATVDALHRRAEQLEALDKGGVATTL